MSENQIAGSTDVKILKRWNWGAFFLGFVWGIGNKLPFTLVEILIPPPLGLFWRIFLAIKGDKWAWQKKDWPSIEDFRRTQRLWAIFGFLFFIALFLPLIIFFTYEMLLIR